ncbi:Uma2 family endonuclease [Streptomyces sp. KLOTTS4A1]|uniref:Uma2 family endonuclease n=1 Tax=Streptomyces sp. KLOTTS4A1 TaxID=3390996 RepID=UPI0039F50AE6
MGAVTAAEAHTEEQAMRATSETWMYPPEEGWTWDQVKELDLPFDWELVDGNIVVRGVTSWWHDQVRNELYVSLRLAERPPYKASVERWTQIGPSDAPNPDVIVYDKTGLNVKTLDCTPMSSVVLAVEVVSPGSRSEDRFRKPGLYAEAEVAAYWRVERGEKDVPEVHEFWRDEASGVFVPRPGTPVHTDRLITDVPFPVEIDLAGLLED